MLHDQSRGRIGARVVGRADCELSHTGGAGLVKAGLEVARHLAT